MDKKIENVFHFRDYRQVLSNDFFLRNDENPSYSMRSYARDLQVSNSFLSEVIKNKKDLSLKKSRSIFTNLGFNEDELDYMESLIILSTSDDKSQLKSAQETFDYYFSKSSLKEGSKKVDKLATTSPEHFLVYSLLHEYTQKEDIYNVTRIFNIDDHLVDEAIEFFLEVEYIQQEDMEYKVTNPQYSITRHENYCQFLEQLAQFFFKHYKETNLNHPDTCSASQLIIPLDAKAAQEIHKLNQYYIHEFFKIARSAGEADRFAFVTHLYQEKNISEPTKAKKQEVPSLLN